MGGKAWEYLREQCDDENLLRDIRKWAMAYRRLMTQGRGLTEMERERRDRLQERLSGSCSGDYLELSDIADIGWPTGADAPSTCWINVNGG